jgi:ribonuclease VapC
MGVSVADYVLDSFALLAYFGREDGSEQVKELIKRALQGGARLHMSLINLGEVYYITYREHNKADADSLLSDAHRLPIDIVAVDEAHVVSAAALKAQIAFSYADAFAASLAQRLNAPLVTGDPEFSKANDIIAIIWLPINIP